MPRSNLVDTCNHHRPHPTLSGNDPSSFHPHGYPVSRAVPPSCLSTHQLFSVPLNEPRCSRWDKIPSAYLVTYLPWEPSHRYHPFPLILNLASGFSREISDLVVGGGRVTARFLAAHHRLWEIPASLSLKTVFPWSHSGLTTSTNCGLRLRRYPSESHRQKRRRWSSLPADPRDSDRSSPNC